MAESKNPFDVLAAIVASAENYETACKKVWTALHDGTLPEDTVIKLLVSASAMPAIAAANIQMEQVLRSNGLLKEEPQVSVSPEPVKAASGDSTCILQFPKNGQVVN